MYFQCFKLLHFHITVFFFFFCDSALTAQTMHFREIVKCHSLLQSGQPGGAMLYFPASPCQAVKRN